MISMPTTILLLLIAAPILALSVLSGVDWSPEAPAAAKTGLGGFAPHRDPLGCVGRA